MARIFHVVPAVHPTQWPIQCPIHWNWITLVGPDAQDFLHRVTTVNTKSLEIGQGASGCFLNAQGKIRVYFKLWRFDTSAYAFEFDAGATDRWKTDLLSAIDQFTFSEKMELTDLTPVVQVAQPAQLECYWLFIESESPDLAQAELEKLGVSGLKSGETRAIDEEIRVCHHGDADYGRTWLSVWGRPARLSQWIERVYPENRSGISYSELETWRVQALRPRVDQEITETAIPLEIGLKEAISENKGCYPGQEVIERIIALGSPSRRLARIDGQGIAPRPGDPIFNLAEPPVEIGQVTSSIPSDIASKIPGDIQGNNPQQSFHVLGFIRKIHAKEGLPVRFASSEGAIVKIAPYA